MAQAGPVNSTMLSLTPAELAGLPAQDQAQYMRGLSPAQLQLFQKTQTVSANRSFMRNSIEKVAYCPVTGGSGTTAAYSAGQTLYFDFPKVPGYGKALLITYNLTVTPNAGTGATYAVNAGAPFSIFSKFEIDYNGPQVTTHPYFACKLMDQLNGFQHGAQNAVVAGFNDGTVAAQIVGSTPIVIGAANVWQGKMLVRLNPLGHDTVPGVLPTSGVGNSPQIKLTCTSNFIGQDPLYQPIAPVAGTGHSATTVTGNVNVDMVYLDGTNMNVPTALQLAWQAEPTVQYSWENALTPFTAGSVNQIKTIVSKLKHWYAVAVVIDGNQANQFAKVTNLTQFALSPDGVGQQTFEGWNWNNNVSIYDYFDRRVRRVFGQDLDEGVIPWVVGPSRGVIDASNRTGSQFLNMTQGGFPAASHMYQVGTVGGQSTIDGYPAATPRVELFLISENPAGLKVS
jgi:hypothetical protein